MAQLVAAFGSSHSIMLVSQREDWQHGFRAIDTKNVHYYDKQGNKTDYDALLAAKAESGSAVSPDFAFNLAVSLERLNQTQPAFNFYREALEQSRLVNPGFDVRVLRERLAALERVLP